MPDGSAHAAKAPTGDSKSLDAFLTDLTHLSRRHGIVIAGEPVLALIDYEDQGLAYEADDDSRLSLA